MGKFACVASATLTSFLKKFFLKELFGLSLKLGVDEYI